MLKKIFIGLSIISIHEIKTMDVSKPDAQQSICYLARLPLEIRDYIAEFLVFKDRESEEEFLGRSRNKQVVKSPIYRSFCCPWRIGQASKGTYAEFDPSKTKIAVLELLYDQYGLNPALTVAHFSTRGYKSAEQIIHRKSLDYLKGGSDKNIFAISPCGNLFAMIYDKLIESDGGDRHYWEEVLVLEDFIAKTQKELVCEKYAFGAMPIDSIRKKTIAFNKQASEIIVHGNYIVSNSDQAPQNVYAIFSLTSKQEHERKSKKTLDEYFRQHRVCKKITNSLLVKD